MNVEQWEALTPFQREVIELLRKILKEIHLD